MYAQECREPAAAGQKKKKEREEHETLPESAAWVVLCFCLVNFHHSPSKLLWMQVKTLVEFWHKRWILQHSVLMWLVSHYRCTEAFTSETQKDTKGCDEREHLRKSADKQALQFLCWLLPWVMISILNRYKGKPTVASQTLSLTWFGQKKVPQLRVETGQ